MTARTRIWDPQRGQRKGLSLSAARPAVAYEVNFVHCCEQPCPGGAGLLERHGLTQGGQVSIWRPEDPFAATGSFPEDTCFLEDAFALARTRSMSLDREGWEEIVSLLDQHTGLNPFLRADWTFAASLALGRFDGAERAAAQIDTACPDYYLGPLDLGMAAYAMKNWREAQTAFLQSTSRPINSPATQLLASYCVRLRRIAQARGDGEGSAAERTSARPSDAILGPS